MATEVLFSDGRPPVLANKRIWEDPKDPTLINRFVIDRDSDAVVSSDKPIKTVDENPVYLVTIQDETLSHNPPEINLPEGWLSVTHTPPPTVIQRLIDRLRKI